MEVQAAPYASQVFQDAYPAAISIHASYARQDSISEVTIYVIHVPQQTVDVKSVLLMGVAA